MTGGGGNGDAGLAALRPVTARTRVPWEGGRLLHGWWFRARGDRAMPARRDFSPRVMGRHLAGVGLYDVTWPHADRPHFRVRLVGSGITDVLGRDPTGFSAGEVPNVSRLIERFRWAVRERRPYMCVDLPLAWANKDFRSYSTLVMPLSDDGRRVNMLIAHLHFVRIGGPAAG